MQCIIHFLPFSKLPAADSAAPGLSALIEAQKQSPLSSSRQGEAMQRGAGLPQNPFT